MKVKSVQFDKHASIGAIPDGRIIVANGERQDGMKMITVNVDVFDHFNFPHAAVRLTLSVEEAMILSQQLTEWVNRKVGP